MVKRGVAATLSRMGLCRNSEVKRLLQVVLATLLSSASAIAAPATFEWELGQLGLSDGLLLSGSESKSAFLPMPSQATIRDLRLTVNGRAVAPNLERGSLVVSINGLPVDAIHLLPGGQAASRFVLETVPEPFLAVPAGLEVRFRGDLVAPAEFCTAEIDPANSITILPTSSIAYAVELNEITTIADALSLMPQAGVVGLPSQMSETEAAAAIELGVMLLTQNRDFRFATDTDAVVALTVDANAQGAELVNTGEQVRIAVAPGEGTRALAQLWRSAPGVLASAGRVASGEPPGALRPVTNSLTVFENLPPSQGIRSRGEFNLDFPLVGASGRLPSEAVLELAAAPDRSGAPPIATIYLNGQLLSAQRLAIGQNTLRLTLPPDMLDFSNNLRVVVDRALAAQCQQQSGYAVQILSGSGLRYDRNNADGFAAFAGQFGGGVHIALPKTLAGSPDLHAYLSLAARLLHGLGALTPQVEVSFGAAETSLPTIRMAGGPISSIPVADGQAPLNFSAEAALARVNLVAESGVVEVVMPANSPVPQPRVLEFRNGTVALVGNAGVLWQDGATPDRPLLAEARDTGRELTGFFQQYGLWIAVGLLALMLLILAARLTIRKTLGQRPRQ
jgi:hypothetical protein